MRGGPAAYFSGLPVQAIVAALQRGNLPAEASLSAGTFVCNHVFYGLMHLAAGRRGLRAGFLHVPSLSARAIPLEDMVRGIGIVLEVAARRRVTK
jgi:pyroglutamyl-peptidase